MFALGIYSIKPVEEAKVIGTVKTWDGKEIKIHYGDHVHGECWNGTKYDGAIIELEDDEAHIQLDDGRHVAVSGFTINGTYIDLT